MDWIRDRAQEAFAVSSKALDTIHERCQKLLGLELTVLGLIASAEVFSKAEKPSGIFRNIGIALMVFSIIMLLWRQRTLVKSSTPNLEQWLSDSLQVDTEGKAWEYKIACQWNLASAQNNVRCESLTRHLTVAVSLFIAGLVLIASGL